MQPLEQVIIARLREKRRRHRLAKASRVSLAAHVAYARVLNTDSSSFSVWNPVRYFLNLCKVCKSCVVSQLFSNYILVCIIVAGLLVGVQTYPQFANMSVINSLDDLILVSFSIEIILKILSEGLGPWWFFIGPEWTWNLFDLVIVVLSLPYITVVGGNNVKLLRLIRLSRLAKVFNRIERLQMIISGLLGGLRSIFFIIVLLVLVFYLFACAGVLLFRPNDSWHFHSVEIAMLNLLGVASLDSWTDQFYINYFGCDVYPAGFYVTNVTERDVNNALGGIMWCQQPQSQPGVSIAFYVVFIALTSFCVLSLFVSSVSVAMTDSMVAMKAASEERQLRRNILRIDNTLGELQQTPLEHRTRFQTRMVLLLESAFKGRDMSLLSVLVDRSCSLRALYKRLSHLCDDLVRSQPFINIMTIVILGAGITVGLNTDPVLSETFSVELNIVDSLILYVFIFELILKLVAECFHPWHYFHDGWNCFDFVVVVGSIGLGGTDSASLITVLRLLRLLRVLKLMRAVSELQVITSALLNGMSSMIYIVLILVLFFYFFAIIGITFLADNDPWHFAVLHTAVTSLFQVATFDNWWSMMAISLYGCEAQPGNYPTMCTTNHPQFIFAAVFFTAVVLVGGLVLLTLFIGVVSMSMEEANVETRKEIEVRRRAALIAKVEQLSDAAVDGYREVFAILDMTGSNAIGKREMAFGLRVAGLTTDQDAIDEIWSKVDRDGSTGIDFSEFLEFVLDLRYQLCPTDTISSSSMFSPGNGSSVGLSAWASNKSGKARRTFDVLDVGSKDKGGIKDRLLSRVEEDEDGRGNDKEDNSLRVESHLTQSGKLDLFCGVSAATSGKYFVERDVCANAESEESPEHENEFNDEKEVGVDFAAPGSCEREEEDKEEFEVHGRNTESPTCPHVSKTSRVVGLKMKPATQVKTAAAATNRTTNADAAVRRSYQLALHSFSISKMQHGRSDGRKHEFLIKPVLLQAGGDTETAKDGRKNSIVDGSQSPSAIPNEENQDVLISLLSTSFRKPGGTPWPLPEPLPLSKEQLVTAAQAAAEEAAENARLSRRIQSSFTAIRDALMGLLRMGSLSLDRGEKGPPAYVEHLEETSTVHGQWSESHPMKIIKSKIVAL